MSFFIPRERRFCQRRNLRGTYVSTNICQSITRHYVSVIGLIGLRFSQLCERAGYIIRRGRGWSEVLAARKERREFEARCPWLRFATSVNADRGETVPGERSSRVEPFESPLLSILRELRQPACGAVSSFLEPSCATHFFLEKFAIESVRRTTGAISRH